MSAVIIGIILILIDIFFLSDLPTVFAIILFSYAFYTTLNYEQLINILLSLVFFLVFFILYVSFWRKTKEYIIDKWLAKDVYKAGVYNFPGHEGTVKIIEGKKVAMIDGDVYAFYEDYNIAESQKFIVKEVKDGKIVIEQSSTGITQ